MAQEIKKELNEIISSKFDEEERTVLQAYSNGWTQVEMLGKLGSETCQKLGNSISKFQRLTKGLFEWEGNSLDRKILFNAIVKEYSIVFHIFDDNESKVSEEIDFSILDDIEDTSPQVGQEQNNTEEIDVSVYTVGEIIGEIGNIDIDIRFCTERLEEIKQTILQLEERKKKLLSMQYVPKEDFDKILKKL